jgi:hypothetical protein
MTLIEIVAGLVILGTILASLAIARGRFARQWADAERKLSATRALDALIATWMQEPRVPVNRQGPLPQAPNLTWRTRAIRDRDAATLSAGILRVEVLDHRLPDSEAHPVVSVDLLVHVAPTMPGMEGR